MKSKLPGVICLGVCIAILVAGLWPFFWPKNEVKWLPDKNGISFYGKGIVYTPDPLNVFTQNLSQNNNPISIELWLQSKVKPIRHLNHFYSVRWHHARILSLYTDKKSEDLTIGQWKSNLIVRSRLTNSKKKTDYKEISIENALPFGRMRLITITSEAKGTAIYQNGKLAKFYPDFVLIANNMKASGQLLLGNTPNIKNPWIGNLLGLAIYSQSLTEEEAQRHYQSWLEDGNPTPSTEEKLAALYLFNEHNSTFVHDSSGHQYNLLIPKTLQELQQKDIFLSLKGIRINRSFFKDTFVNILGFIPLGFVISIYLYSFKSPSWYRIYLTTILIGVGISLTIELLQIYIPTRGPSFIDLACNIFGTVLGVSFFNCICIFKKQTNA